MRITELEIQEYTEDCRREIGWRIQDRRLAMGLRAVDMAAYLGIGRPLRRCWLHSARRDFKSSAKMIFKAK